MFSGTCLVHQQPQKLSKNGAVVVVKSTGLVPTFFSCVHAFRLVCHHTHCPSIVQRPTAWGFPRAYSNLVMGHAPFPEQLS